METIKPPDPDPDPAFNFLASLINGNAASPGDAVPLMFF
jgi:hypothetical protein